MSVKKVFLKISQNPQGNTVFYRTPLVVASEKIRTLILIKILLVLTYKKSEHEGQRHVIFK